MGRVFLQTNINQEINAILSWIFLGLFFSLAGIISLVSSSCSGTPFAMMAVTFQPQFLFAVIIGIQHRNDYGDEKLLLHREVNSGTYYAAIWLAKTVKSLFFGAIKMFAHSLVLYIFMAPLQSFGTYLLAYILLAWWWIGFAQWVSLLCSSQTSAVMILLLIPLFESIFSGNFCSTVIHMPDDSLKNTFCPRGSMDGLGYFPGRDFFAMVWSAEMDRYPEHVSIFPDLNMTNYWYDFSVDEGSKEGISPMRQEKYTGNLYAYSGGLGPWTHHLVVLIRLNVLRRLDAFIVLALMASSTNRWWAAKFA